MDRNSEQGHSQSHRRRATSADGFRLILGVTCLCIFVIAAMGVVTSDAGAW